MEHMEVFSRRTVLFVKVSRRKEGVMHSNFSRLEFPKVHQDLRFKGATMSTFSTLFSMTKTCGLGEAFEDQYSCLSSKSDEVIAGCFLVAVNGEQLTK